MSPCTSIAELLMQVVVVQQFVVLLVVLLQFVVLLAVLLQFVVLLAVLLLAVPLQEVLLFFIIYFFFLSKLKKRPKLKTSRLLWPRYQTRSEKVSGLK